MTHANQITVTIIDKSFYFLFVVPIIPKNWFFFGKGKSDYRNISITLYTFSEKREPFSKNHSR